MRKERALAFHPGSYIKDILEEEELSVEEFADKLDLPKEVVEELVRYETSITQEIAGKLEKATGVSAKTWINLQKIYDMLPKE